ncbi:MAG: hypothetical protein SFU53_03690 [Terrimicrobiaceae bacterium]|nr:hypothetical protein [Terrimicrobiaceae bacterium]
MKTALTLVIWLVGSGMAWADGGVVLARDERDGIVVTVFAAPFPLHVGANDVSVLVQKGREVVGDFSARVTLRPVEITESRDEWLELCNTLNGIGLTGEAVPSAQGNRLLRSAWIGLPASGRWEVSVDVAVDGRSFAIRRPVDVKPPPNPWAAWWPFLAMVPAVVGLYVWRQRLRRRN